MSGRKKAKPAVVPRKNRRPENSPLRAPPRLRLQKEPRRRKRSATALEDRIGYRFTDAALLECALTHISALKGARNRAGSYQRLEFLGDHVLGLVISDMLFRAFPKADEGELSRRLADLVRKETCAEIARTIDLGAAIRVGSSEANAGARKRPAILADVCEALIGAVYLDGGYKAAEELVERLWQARMRANGAAAARSQNRIAGMGAGARLADAGLSRSGALRSRPQSGIPRRRAASRLCARRRHRAAPSAPRNRPRRPPCWRARASSDRTAQWLSRRIPATAAASWR